MALTDIRKIELLPLTGGPPAISRIEVSFPGGPEVRSATVTLPEVPAVRVIEVSAPRGPAGPPGPAGGVGELPANVLRGEEDETDTYVILRRADGTAFGRLIFEPYTE